MKKFAGLIIDKIKAAVDLRDLFVFFGLGCCAYGAGQIYAPASWLVIGVALFWLGVRG